MARERGSTTRQGQHEWVSQRQARHPKLKRGRTEQKGREGRRDGNILVRSREHSSQAIWARKLVPIYAYRVGQTLYS